MKVNNTLLNLHGNNQVNNKFNQTNGIQSKTHQIWAFSQINQNPTVYSQSLSNNQQKTIDINQEQSVKDNEEQNMTSSCVSQSRYSQHIQNLQNQNLKIKVQFYRLRFEQSVAECQNLASQIRQKEQHNQKLSFDGQQNIKRFELYIKELLQEIRDKDERISLMEQKNHLIQDKFQNLKAQIMKKCQQIYALEQINKKINEEFRYLQTKQFNKNEFLLSKQRETIIQKDFTIQQFQMLLFSKDNEINMLTHDIQLFLQKQKNMEKQILVLNDENMYLNKCIKDIKEQLRQKVQSMREKQQEQKRCQSLNQIKQVIQNYSQRFQQFQHKTQKQKKQTELLNQRRSKEQSNLKYVANLIQQNQLYCIYNQNLQKEIQKYQAREINLEQNLAIYEDKSQSMGLKIQELVQMVEKRNDLIKQLRQSRQNLLNQIKSYAQKQFTLKLQIQILQKHLQQRKQSQRETQNEMFKLKQELSNKSRLLELRSAEINEKEGLLVYLKKQKTNIIIQMQKNMSQFNIVSYNLKNTCNQLERIMQQDKIYKQKIHKVQIQNIQLKKRIEEQASIKKQYQEKINRLKKDIEQIQNSSQGQSQKICSKKYIYEPLQTRTKVLDHAKTLKVINNNQKLSQENIQKYYNRLTQILQQINQNYQVFQTLMNQQQTLKIKTLNSIAFSQQQNSISIDKANPYASIDRLILLVREQQTAYQHIQQKLKHKYSKTQQIPQLIKPEQKLSQKQTVFNEKQTMMRAKSQENISTQLLNWKHMKINRDFSSPFQHQIKCNSEFELSNSPYRKFQTMNVQFSRKNISKQGNQKNYQPCSRTYLPQY